MGRHLPLWQRHPHAERAAVASEAAAAQGAFWEMHEKLLDHQSRLREPDLLGYAHTLGLDVQRFRANLAARTPRKRVSRHRRSGVESTVRSPDQ